jgi:hypothetical protein
VKANLSEANFAEANLCDASLREANLSGSRLCKANLSGADLMRVKLDDDVDLNKATFSTTTLRDIRWNGVDLTQVRWGVLSRLGDDTDSSATSEDKTRANMQLATRLREQSISYHANRFAYRAQVWHRRVLRERGGFMSYLGSLFLDLLAGYGYKPARTLIAYLLVIGSFTLIMRFGVVDASCSITGVTSSGSLNASCTPTHNLALREAFVFSLTSFHGRGFFPGGLGLDSPITFAAAIEAVIGLIIEVSFIATFTQRFFGR